MNKKELIRKVASDMNYTQKDTEAVVAKVFDVITDTLVSGDEVSITGFGKFNVVERPQHEGVNPSTGEKITIKASRTPKFKASKVLKEALN